MTPHSALPANHGLGAVPRDEPVPWRLAVPTVAFMLLSSLDRVNVSFAALRMNHALGLTPHQFGIGAGILFVGFLLGQYPSLLLLQRIGMHRWLPLCAGIWGGCALAMAFVRSSGEFYALRVVLGAAEGGLAPGIVWYLSRFTPSRRVARPFMVPMLAVPLSIIVGGPLSGWLMDVRAPGALSGWKWMFIVESVPTLLLGLAAWFYFPDGPHSVAAAAPGESRAIRNNWTVLAHPLLWLAAALWFCLLAGAYGIMFWLPQMIARFGDIGPTQVGIVNSAPWAAAMIGMYVNSVHSDRSGERYWHVILPSTIAAIAMLCAAETSSGATGLFALCVLGLGLGAAQGAFWALPATLFDTETLGVGATAINIAGSAGGLVTPIALGYVVERTAATSVQGPALLISAVLVGAAILTLAMRARSRRPTRENTFCARTDDPSPRRKPRGQR